MSLALQFEQIYNKLLDAEIDMTYSEYVYELMNINR